jgi:hypothetical protein
VVFTIAASNSMPARNILRTGFINPVKTSKNSALVLKWNADIRSQNSGVLPLIHSTILTSRVDPLAAEYFTAQ